ncbi:hypothetical protein HQ590_07910 [bacterium]|nr:hypothetical protein [bacterium]
MTRPLPFLQEFAHQPYRCGVAGTAGPQQFRDDELADRAVEQRGGELVVTGRFAGAGLRLVQTFRETAGALDEQITLVNDGAVSVHLDAVELGFVADLSRRADWRLCAIPFRVQLDGSVHDYSVDALRTGEFKNAVYSDTSRPEPLDEQGRLRSEAWAWGTGERGLVIMKYNPDVIELSVACPHEGTLRFGGAGFCLYGEPSPVRELAPGQSFAFGVTRYVPYHGGLAQAFYTYRAFLEQRGHGFPPDYNPPVNWNELYDVGWFHSNREELQQHYTRETLLREAAKAKAVGCELLYLDPGWEVEEGTTRWDEDRLGPVAELAATLRDQYGLGLGYRTILRSYSDHWPRAFLVKAADRELGPVLWNERVPIWELCLSNPICFAAKLDRLLAITEQGVQFLMVDEMEWRRPCTDPAHGHPVPSTPFDHARAVLNLCQEVRRRCPGLVIECHDPVWPWFNSRYLPTYFGQGFGDRGCYQENWGFEYMWDCLNDLRTGKALALYYYNLACNIPLYLHITMAADNDQAVFFWWTASTVRHLGIGGMTGHPSINPKDLPAHDPEKRFALYQREMKLYRQLKPYFVRGTFHGIAEHIHLHTLPGTPGGVINLFNLTDTEQEFEVTVPRELLGATGELPVSGAAGVTWTADALALRHRLPPLSPAVITVGAAVAAENAGVGET